MLHLEGTARFGDRPKLDRDVFTLFVREDEDALLARVSERREIIRRLV